MKKQVVKVSVDELISVIKSIEVTQPNTFLGIKMRTLFTDDRKKHPKTNEINPYYKQIWKTSKRSFRLVTNYQKRVWNNLKKEGKLPENFTVESPKGKKHVSESVLIDTKTETTYYVMLEWFSEHGSSTTYEFEGKPIDKVLFEKWVTEKDKNLPLVPKQGLDDEVTVITPKIENILELSYGGKVYEVVK
jgi:hypothetical protein